MVGRIPDVNYRSTGQTAYFPSELSTLLQHSLYNSFSSLGGSKQIIKYYKNGDSSHLEGRLLICNIFDEQTSPPEYKDEIRNI